MTKSIINNRKLNKKAFTLVEIMVAIMLTTIVLTAIFLIWSRVSAGIARSSTKQRLQNELRRAANYMQNDFKTIKYYADDPEKAFKRTGDDENWVITFEKFDELKENEDKIAQDVSKLVTYEKKNSVLTRKYDGKTNILLVCCDNVNIDRTTNNSTDYEDADTDLKSAKDSKLDIEITGKMTIPGTNEEMYITEKSSVVMRNEYYTNQNKNFVSTFDLTKKETSDVIIAGDASNLQVGEVLDLEFLKTLNDDVLSGMDKTQEDMLKETMERLDEINDAINKTDTGESAISKFGQWLNFFSDSEGEQVRGLRSELAGIEAKISKDEKDLSKIKSEYGKAIDKTLDVKKKLEEFTSKKEDEFLGKSISNYSSLSQKEKDIYKKAYEMRLQDRNLEGAFNKLTDEEKEEMGGKPPTNYDRLSGNFTMTNEDQEMSKITDGSGNTINTSNNSQTAENKEILAAYEKIDLSWMKDFGDEPEDVGIYNAAKQLITQADTKLDMLRMEQVCAENRGNIAIAMRENGDN